MGCRTSHYFYSAEKQKEWRDFVRLSPVKADTEILSEE